MPWIKIVVYTTGSSAPAIDKLFNQMGALSVTFQASDDGAIFDPAPGETFLWNKTEVTALFSADRNVKQLEMTLVHSSPFSSNMTYHIEVIEDKCWQREWMNYFHPLKFGSKLWVCPSWRKIVDTEAVNVILDPGLAFGTGTHATTALCLTWLEGLVLAGKTVIDYGCGSGILALAALKLGAAEAIAVDIDQDARSATLENAIKNRVSDRLTILHPNDLTTDKKADVVVANILASTLKTLAPDIQQRVKTDGLLAISGILTDQTEDVFLSYQSYFLLNTTISLNEWSLISAIKK